MTDGMQRVAGPAGSIAVHLRGRIDAPVVAMTHSILSSSMMWESQAELLATAGYRVACIDTRGHGASDPCAPRCTMDELAADTVAVLDALEVDQAHYVGLSLGGMSGFALGRRFPERLKSLVICDARADAPPSVSAPWDARIAMAERDGTRALGQSTLERWFGRPFLDANPAVARRFLDNVAATSTGGFIACARAIQSLDELSAVDRITVPTTFIVGSNDGALPQAMADLQARVAASALEVIHGAGHLPNIDQPVAFDAALLRHFQRVDPRR